ncbi:MAG: hypothetical protein AAF602_32565 [Myxococcota bacterium]
MASASPRAFEHAIDEQVVQRCDAALGQTGARFLPRPSPVWRRYHAGEHAIDVQVDGVASEAAPFGLRTGSDPKGN